MNAREKPNSEAERNRRVRLQQWIDDYFGGQRPAFIASTFDGDKQLSTGDLSALLGTKSFGESRARTLEAQAGMPKGYLDLKADAAGGHQAGEHAILAVQWPFRLVSFERLLALQKALGARKGAAAVRDIDKYLDVAVQKWENELL